jgi:AraC-like DNA-binding protein
LIAFLQTGQILLNEPDGASFAQATKNLLQLGVEMDVKRLEEAYFQTRVISKKQYESIVRLLTIFAQHLSTLSNQLIVGSESPGMPSIAKARTLIAERYADELSLGEVARAVNMSAFYFCKSFKKVTGITFTEYLARIRVEKVKNLLLNPNRRVSEAAYEAGFQSLSQFNRVFLRIAGESPSAYRERLHGRGER